MTTIEAIKWLKEDINVREIFPIDGDTTLEVFKVAVDALEKQIPKRPIIWLERDYFSPDPYDDSWGYECPCCGARDIDEDEHHCICGQELDWSEIV